MGTAQLSLTLVIDGFLMACRARRLSENTLKDYQNTINKFILFKGYDPIFADISKEDITEFLAVQTVSNKTLLNYHVGLSALYTWAVEDGLAKEHILHQVARPKPQKREIVEFSKEEIRSLMRHADISRIYFHPGQGQAQNQPVTPATVWATTSCASSPASCWKPSRTTSALIWLCSRTCAPKSEQWSSGS